MADLRSSSAILVEVLALASDALYSFSCSMSAAIISFHPRGVTQYHPSSCWHDSPDTSIVSENGSNGLDDDTCGGLLDDAEQATNAKLTKIFTRCILYLFA